MKKGNLDNLKVKDVMTKSPISIDKDVLAVNFIANELKENNFIVRTYKIKLKTKQLV